jgi:hypothetical protein
MNIALKFECSHCPEDEKSEAIIRIETDGKTLPTMREIREKLKEYRWVAGRDCYCPTCYSTLTAHCSDCEFYEGNKVMGAPICLKDGKFAAPTDYCKNHKSFRKENNTFNSGKINYKNPIPTID